MKTQTSYGDNYINIQSLLEGVRGMTLIPYVSYSCSAESFLVKNIDQEQSDNRLKITKPHVSTTEGLELWRTLSISTERGIIEVLKLMMSHAPLTTGTRTKIVRTSSENNVRLNIKGVVKPLSGNPEELQSRTLFRMSPSSVSVISLMSLAFASG